MEETVTQKKLFKLDSTGFNPSQELPLTNGRLQRASLTSDGLFLVVGSSSKLYLWIGKTVPAALKKEAMACAMAYIKHANLPASTAVQRVSEGVETSAFKGEFYLWEPPMQWKPSGVGNARQIAQTEVDYAALVARKVSTEYSSLYCILLGINNHLSLSIYLCRLKKTRLSTMEVVNSRYGEWKTSS